MCVLDDVTFRLWSGTADERTPLLQQQGQMIDHVIAPRVGEEGSERSMSICGDFLLAVSPIDVSEWKDRGDRYHLKRIYAVFKVCLSLYSFIHSFILAISIAPLQVHYYSINQSISFY